MARELLDKVIVWKNPDDSVMVTYLYKNGHKLGETDKDYIDREVAKLLKEQKETFIGKPYLIQNLSDLPDASQKRKWRIDVNNKIKVDANVKTEKELFDEMQSLIKGKLTSGESLTSDEAEWMVT